MDGYRASLTIALRRTASALAGGFPLKKLSVFELLRVWAAATGLLLAVWFFGALHVAAATSPLLPLLIAAIGGFELFLFAQDLWLKRQNQGR